MPRAPQHHDPLDLAVLAAFAVAQPLFDPCTRHPQFLIAHGLEAGDLLLVAVL